jgi:hypothetical protein
LEKLRDAKPSKRPASRAEEKQFGILGCELAVGEVVEWLSGFVG